MYLIYQQETATNTTKSTDVNPGVNRAWLGSIWPSAGFVPKSAGFSAELILLAMLEVPFLPDCVAIKKFQRKNGTNLILILIKSPVHTIYLLALSLKSFYLQTSMNWSWKWQNMQFFCIIQKKKQTEENVRLQSTVLHANFFFSFCLKFIFHFLIIFQYLKNIVFCSPFFRCILIVVFFWNFYILDLMLGSIIFARKCTEIPSKHMAH